MADNKLFLGGNTYVFKGKEVLFFIFWLPSRSITSAILHDKLEELNHLKIFNRENGVIFALLFDGHGSRFNMDFLEYINYISHPWVTCIMIPYRTTL